MDFDHGNGNSKYAELGTGSSSRGGGERSGHSSEESESSKYSRRHLEFEYEPRSSKHSSEGSGRSRDSDVYPDIINKRGGNESNHFEITTESFKGWGNDNVFEIHQEAIDGSYSSKRSEVIQAEKDMNEGHIVHLSTEKMKLSSSSPSSSSQLSTDDQFEDDIKLSKSRSGITSIFSPNFHEDTEKSLKDEHHVSGNNPSKSAGQIGTAGVSWKSQVSSLTCESTSTQSPPIQVMDRLGDYDPNRIPSAVFARSQSTTPADWSIASNESLFSIQVGNNSFSRDHILSLKSGELFKSGEFIAFSPSPVSPTVYTDTNSVELDKSEAVLVPDDAVKKKTGLSVEKPKHPTVSWNASMNSKHSDDSATSFAFPIRKKKKKKEKEKKEKKKQKKCAWPSCYCSNCSWAFCHCTWPSCCLRWPSCRWPSGCFRWPSYRWPGCCCSNCSWASCYCWNCSIKRWCCHFSTDLTDRGNDGMKETMEQQRQQQPLASAVPSKSACCSCWTCSPSCQWRCHWCCCCSCNCCCCNSC